jgi:hypothetical protein
MKFGGGTCWKSWMVADSVTGSEHDSPDLLCRMKITCSSCAHPVSPTGRGAQPAPTHKEVGASGCGCNHYSPVATKDCELLFPQDTTAIWCGDEDTGEAEKSSHCSSGGNIRSMAAAKEMGTDRIPPLAALVTEKTERCSANLFRCMSLVHKGGQSAITFYTCSGTSFL